MTFYNQKIKPHSKHDCVGVIRLIQILIDRGLGVDALATALENYEADPWRRANPRYSKHIRAFFTFETIQEWQQPRPGVVKPDVLPGVTQFQADFIPKPNVPESLPTLDPSVDETDL